MNNLNYSQLKKIRINGFKKLNSFLKHFLIRLSNLNGLLFLLLFFNFLIQAQEKPEPKEKNMEMSFRITSDHHFRGYNYSMLASQRNNTQYQEFNMVPAAQPQFDYSTPLKGLKTSFWGNFFLNNLSNRDSDFHILQDGPGMSEKVLPNGTIQNPYPNRTKRYKERNGLSQYDGLFFTIYYQWNTEIGTWSFGTWIWNNLNRLGKYTWQEYFIWYEPPFLKSINPKIHFFVNTSFDNAGASQTTTPLGVTNGQNYLYYEMSYKFCDKCKIQIVPKFQIGYISNNDNINKRSGIANMIQSLKFIYEEFDIVLNAMYRPDPILYDTFDPNRNDSKLPDPSKQNSVLGKSMLSQLNSMYPKEIADSIFYESNSQHIPKLIYFFTTGYTISF